MITVTFCISLRINFLSVFFERIINSLDFTPNKMDIYYNEFSTPKFFIKYNPKLLQLLSLAEVDGGITSFNLYDNKYSNENVIPFFRAKILDTTFSNNQVICILEWVSYPTLYFTPNIHFLSSYLCDEAKIVFLFAYDQFDVRYKSEKTNYIKSLLSPQLRWRKLVMVKSMPFIAAPVMFFGKEYFSIIPKAILLKVPNSQEFIIKNQDIVAIKLFGLYENPNLHRDSQKRYWKTTSLSLRIKKYQENVFSEDAITQYKKRYKKMKEGNVKKRNKS